MATNRGKVSNLLDRSDDIDVSTFGGFLNSILRQFPNAPNLPNFPHFPNKPPQGPSQVEFRTIDGTANNEANPTLNAPETAFARITPAQFADGIHEMRPNEFNPRMISNTVLGQGGPDAAATPNPKGLSGMLHVWGQFIDHDLDLLRSANPPDPANIAGEDLASPIPFNRAAIAPGTGVDTPAESINRITGWLDGSMVYGSSQTTADALRAKDAAGNLLAKLATSAGDNLPLNAAGTSFQAGDVRAAENPALTSLHVLFVREHNFQVDRLAELHPEWDQEQLYQMARAIVGAEIANITYNEFLTHLLGPNWIGRYKGYDPDVDPTISTEFAGAAYRFGHSMVSNQSNKLAENGELLDSDTLAAAFAETPAGFVENGGADALLRFTASDHSMTMDARIIDDLRNFLADGPGRIDLAAINIQRGRDLGLGTLNETREALGLKPYTKFEQITKDAATIAALKEAYGENGIDNIDLWVGGLAEKAARGAAVGETFKTIIGMQFEALRDGDRLWFENQGFDRATLREIKGTTLADIIERNSDIQHIQDDVFVYYDRHSGALGGIAGENPNAPQLVIGSEGDDTLVGGPKGDMLVAADGGLQTMTGKRGPDQFIFGSDMDAKITDFKPGVDKIVFEDAGELDGFRDLKITSQNGNAVIEANGNHIVLLDARPYQLHAHDFVYEM